MAERKKGTDAKNVKRLPLTRGVILAVAREIVKAEGYEALSLRTLAAHFGVTAAALYAHFENKLDLLRAIAAGEFERLIRQYEAVDGSEPIERLCKMAYVYVDFARNDPELFRAMFLFPPGVLSVNLEDLGQHNSHRAFRTLALVVEQAIDEGKLRSEDPILTSVTLWTAVHGIATVVLMNVPVGRRREDLLIHSTVTSVLRGLAPPNSETAAILQRMGRYTPTSPIE